MLPFRYLMILIFYSYRQRSLRDRPNVRDSQDPPLPGSRAKGTNNNEPSTMKKFPAVITSSSKHHKSSPVNPSQKGNTGMKEKHQQLRLKKKRDRSLSSSLTSVCIAFSVCYVPLVITQFFSISRSIHLTKYPSEFSATVNKVFNICMFFASRLVLANSFLNGIIYSCKDKTFLRAAKSVLFKFSTNYNLSQTRHSFSSQFNSFNNNTSHSGKHHF